MERLFYSPGRTREEFRYQAARPSSQLVSRSAFSAPARGNQTVDFATNTVDSLEFPSKLTAGMRNISEKELLQGLNDRFAGFIEKVHHLENQNRALEREIESIRVRTKSSATLSKEYESDLDHLRQQVHKIGLQKHQIEMNRQNLEDEFDILREKYEREARGRGDAEENISVLKKSISNAYLSKQEMDRKAKALEEEIDFLKTNHESEVAEILEQIQESHESKERMDFARSDVTAALRDIRMQLEGHSNSDIRYAEERFRAQLAKLTKAAEVNREALMATKAEINEHRRQLQHKNIELDSVKGVREGLEKQLYDLEQRHNAEIHHYQDTIRELEFELKNAKYDMGSHLREYQDLLNVKMALDAEIYSYRKLLEGEESRQGEATRKAEPQYKFVEEIITETTREDVEISDTGSENEKADVESCDGDVQGEETPQDDENEAEFTDKDAGENPELVGDEVQSAEETGEKEAEPDESTESTELSPKVNPSQEPSNAKDKDEQADMKILNKPKLESEVEKEAEISPKTDEASKENEDSEQLDPKDKSFKDVHSPETTSQGSAKTSDQTVRANSQSKEGKEDAVITPGESVLTKPSDEEHPKPKVDPAEPSSAVKKDTSKQPEEKKHQEAPSEKEQKPEEPDKAEKGKSALSTKSEKQVSESKEKEKPDKLQPTGEKTPVKSKQENSKHDGEDKAAEGKEQDETMTTDAKSKGQDKVPGKSEEIMKDKQPQSANLDVKSEVAESDITSPQTKTSEAVKPSTK